MADLNRCSFPARLLCRCFGATATADAEQKNVTGRMQIELVPRPRRCWLRRYPGTLAEPQFRRAN